MAKLKHVIALFGNIAIERKYCKDCGTEALVIKGKLQCCGAPANDSKPTRFFRESSPEQQRRLPGKREREQILRDQEDRCFYCGQRLNSLHVRNGKPLFLKLNWDHYIPYAMSQNNYPYNFVAACHVCNGIKSDHVFQTAEEAQLYLLDVRKKKGYDF